MNDDCVEEEQAVLLVIKLSANSLGNIEELQQIAEIEDEIRVSLLESATGEFDGDEFGPESCTVFMYAPNADVLAGSVLRVLERHNLPEGSYLVKRLGPPGSVEIRTTLPVNRIVQD
jgi:hypothetical protein